MRKSEWDSSDDDEDEGEEPYVKEAVVGKGTFGVVYRAHARTAAAAADGGDGRVYAVKRIRTSSGRARDGVEFTALREIRALRDARHPNVLGLADAYVRRRAVHLVFEFMDSDMERVIRAEHVALPEPHVKAYARMLFAGVAYLHGMHVLHRDLKPGNLLLRWDPATRSTVLKISDFGLSRPMASPGQCLTPQAVTRWYRPPELLFGAERYGAGVDLWSCGCIVAEMLLRVPLFGSSSELDQLNRIFAALGVPTEETWPGVTALPGYIAFAPPPLPPAPLQQIFPAASAEAVALIGKLLSFDPARRGSAAEALEHPFFTSGVPPTPETELPRPPTKDSAAKRNGGAGGDEGPESSRRRVRSPRSTLLEQLNSVVV